MIRKNKVLQNKGILRRLVESITAVGVFASCAAVSAHASGLVFEAGHTSLQQFLVPNEYPHPANNAPSEVRANLGKQLFFDPRLSGDMNMSCATCHSPAMGWSDGLEKAKGVNSQVLKRTSSTIVNVAYYPIIMWDGRIQGEDALEKQVFGPISNPKIMGGDVDTIVKTLSSLPEYVDSFAKAYPGEVISKETISKAIANYERTVISNDTAFDRWVKGDKKAMSKQAIEGFKLFADKEKGNCMACHKGPHFTDNGYHNLGLENKSDENADIGRHKVKPINAMFGAFRTMTVRDAANRAPYFHNGAAANLDELMDIYIKGGEGGDNISANMKKLSINDEEKAAIIAFVMALSTQPAVYEAPVLPMP